MIFFSFSFSPRSCRWPSAPGLQGDARAGSREPGLSAAPGAHSPCPAAGLRAAGHSPRSRARRERGRGGGASFLSETYGIRQEFGPPRFKKTNKGKIVREGPPRAAGPPHCPPHSPSGRPGSPGGGGTRGWGGSPGWSPVGFPASGPRPACYPSLPGDEEAPGRRERRMPLGWLTVEEPPPPQESF